jgi:hypothetical protein
VTFSGAHATGKTTLMGDLVARYDDFASSATYVANSCSQELFRRIREGRVELPKGAKIPKNYDDLNRLGLRGFFQRSLPDALSFEVESAVIRAMNDLPRQANTTVFVDRWFTDILAYTHIESEDAKLHEEVLERCRSRLYELETWLTSRAKTVRLVNVFVPVGSSNFKVPASDKFRATCDRDRWEATCLKHWRTIMPRHAGMLAIESSDRKRRVSQVLQHLGLENPKPSTKA